jgi:hypothetical protein
LSFQAAESRLQERETAGKLDDTEYDNARQRVDVIAHSVLAEAEHFHQHRITDFNEYMRQYLMGQIAFFKTVRMTFVADTSRFKPSFLLVNILHKLVPVFM